MTAYVHVLGPDRFCSARLDILPRNVDAKSSIREMLMRNLRYFAEPGTRNSIFCSIREFTLHAFSISNVRKKRALNLTVLELCGEFALRVLKSRCCCCCCFLYLISLKPNVSFRKRSWGRDPRLIRLETKEVMGSRPEDYSFRKQKEKIDLY